MKLESFSISFSFNNTWFTIKSKSLSKYFKCFVIEYVSKHFRNIQESHFQVRHLKLMNMFIKSVEKNNEIEISTYYSAQLGIRNFRNIQYLISNFRSYFVEIQSGACWSIDNKYFCDLLQHSFLEIDSYCVRTLLRTEKAGVLSKMKFLPSSNRNMIEL